MAGCDHSGTFSKFSTLDGRVPVPKTASYPCRILARRVRSRSRVVRRSHAATYGYQLSAISYRRARAVLLTTDD